MFRADAFYSFRYDDKGQCTRRLEYSPEMKLLRTMEPLPDKAGLISRNPEGRVVSERLYAQGLRREYDPTGEKLLAVRAKLPLDKDLTYGWGPEVNGLSVAVGCTATAGAPEDILLWISVKNSGAAKGQVF